MTINYVIDGMRDALQVRGLKVEGGQVPFDTLDVSEWKEKNLPQNDDYNVKGGAKDTNFSIGFYFGEEGTSTENDINFWLSLSSQREWGMAADMSVNIGQEGRLSGNIEVEGSRPLARYALTGVETGTGADFRPVFERLCDIYKCSD